MPKRQRNYREEYDSYHKKPEQKKRRASRNSARKQLGLKKGDSREAHHKDMNPKNNSRENLAAVSKKYNRKRQPKRT